MRKRQLIFLLILFILSGCSFNSQTEKHFYEKLNNINTSINKLDWQKAKNETDNLKAYYDEKKWKLQLLGYEREYEGINQEIEKLLVIIEEKDPTQAKLASSTIKTYLQSIYQQ